MVYSKDDRIQKCIGLPKLMDGTMREVLTMKNVSQKEILFFKKSFIYNRKLSTLSKMR